MDQILAKAATSWASAVVVFAGKAAFSAAISAARIKFNETAKLRADTKDELEFKELRENFDLEVEAIEPIVELVELHYYRGHGHLLQAWKISQRLRQALTFPVNSAVELSILNKELRDALIRIRELVPFLHLALSTSATPVYSALPEEISTTRLLRASNHLLVPKEGKIGPNFQVHFYKLFRGSIRKPTSPTGWTNEMEKLFAEYSWKEEFFLAEAQLEVERGAAYQLRITENLDDGRFHEPEEKPQHVLIKVGQILQLFYSATGTLLRIPDLDRPVFVIKSVANEAAAADYYALGMFSPDELTPDSDDVFSTPSSPSSPPPPSLPSTNPPRDEESLSLLEYMLKLASLECVEGKSHLECSDAKLHLYLRNNVRPAE